jgi:hypothetical protein
VTSPQRPVCLLTLAAWRLAGLTLSDLWGRYIGLGGHQAQTELADYLAAVAAWSDAEHNVLAQTLNEALWDLGLPSLAPPREAKPATRNAAPGT